MVKQVSISDELAEFLDHFRKEWGNPGTLSYTKTIERFIEATNEEEIIRREIVKLFKDLQFRLPKNYFHQIEVMKAAVIAMVEWDEEERNRFCDYLTKAIHDIKENLRFAERVR